MKKKGFCSLIPVLILALIVVWGCNKDDEEDNGNPTQPQNNSPVIQNVTASPAAIAADPYHYCYGPDDGCTFTCIATDADRDSLTYYWSSIKGTFVDGINMGISVSWCPPAMPDTCMIQVVVSDGIATDEDSVAVVVY